MLKIKSNVDLKELEKFGFEPRYDTYTGEILQALEKVMKICIIDKENKDG